MAHEDTMESPVEPATASDFYIKFPTRISGMLMLKVDTGAQVGVIQRRERANG